MYIHIRLNRTFRNQHFW